MSHPIADLLKRALLVGAREVRLTPGRRTIVVVPAGESEVKGEPQTLDGITALISPVMTAQAKQQMTTGFCEWEFELEGRGTVRARAEVKGSLLVSFFLIAVRRSPSKVARAQPRLRLRPLRRPWRRLRR